MFAPHLGVREDPATGSAAAAFAGALMQCEPLGDGEHSFVIEQGYEMRRPSEIALQIVIREGALASAEIGGGAGGGGGGSLFLWSISPGSRSRREKPSRRPPPLSPRP